MSAATGRGGLSMKSLNIAAQFYYSYYYFYMQKK